jgi:hypothetical protein
VLTDGGYKVDGDVKDSLWWAMKLCRFGAGELDGFVPGLRRVAAEAPLSLLGEGWPGREAGSLGALNDVRA